MSDLPVQRDKLFQAMYSPLIWSDIKTHWQTIQPLIDNWWSSYKAWEKIDTFNAAFVDGRMSVRTFDEDFEYQKSKTFSSLTLAPDRFKSDKNHTPVDTIEAEKHAVALANSPQFWARRGIDSSAFANPDNFKLRESKYSEGVHDLSASLLNPANSIFKQIHNKGDGANFSFVPLSMEADQLVLYNLIQAAKGLKATMPEFYVKVRGYRARMTRVKIAHDYDMGTGFTAIPMLSTAATLPYKIRYSLGNKTTHSATVTLDVTAEVFAARQKAALNFKSILAKGKGKNEIIIALRQHAGPFPVYASRKGSSMFAKLECYDIIGQQRKYNGKLISASGVMS